MAIDEELYKKMFDEAESRDNLIAKQNALAELYSDLTETTNKYREALEGGVPGLTKFYREQNLLAMRYNSLASKMQQSIKTLDTFKNATPTGKMLYLGQALSTAGKSLTDLRDKIYDLQQKLGTTFGSAISVGTDAFLNQITSFFSGGPVLSFKDTIDAVNAFQQEFGGLLTRGEAQKLAQASKLFGISAQQLAKAQRSFLVVGGDRTQAIAIARFREAGLTAAGALQFAANNANLVAIAGNKYADSLFRAAADAQRIGVSLSSTEKLADGIVGDFEGALERFSELRAMGVEVDFNKLAEVAGTGTPEEVLSELQGQLGGNQNLLAELQRNRFLKVALERDLGLNIAEITRLAAGETAKSPAETQEEKDRTVRDKILERLGTVITFVGGLASAIALLGTGIVSNTMATNANTLAMKGNPAGIGNMLKGLFKGGGGTGMSMLARGGLIGAGLTAGAAGIGYGSSLVGQGKTKTGIGVGAAAGGIGALLTAIGILGAVPTGGASLALLAGGAALGGGSAYMLGRPQATGGLITGPGTATSDSILTPLSTGEFVISAKATKRIGTDVLAALNAGARLGPGKASGGLVGDATHIGQHALVEGLGHAGEHGIRGINYAGASTSLTKGLFKQIPLVGSIFTGVTDAADDYSNTGNLKSALAMGAVSGIAGYLGGSAGMGIVSALAASGVGVPFAASILLTAAMAYGFSKLAKTAMQGAQARSSDPRIRAIAATRSEYTNPHPIDKNIPRMLASAHTFGEPRAPGGPVKVAPESMATKIVSDTLQNIGLKTVSKMAPFASNALLRGTINAIPGIGDVLSGFMVAIEELDRTKDYKKATAIGSAYMLASATAGGSAATAAGGAGLIAGPGAIAVAPLSALFADAFTSVVAGEAFLAAARAATSTKTKNTEGLASIANNIKKADDAEIKPSAGYGTRALLFNNNDTIMAGTKLMSPGTLKPEQQARQEQPEIKNVVNVNLDKMEAKLDRLAAALGNIKIDMDGSTVGRVSLNSRSPLDHLSVV